MFGARSYDGWKPTPNGKYPQGVPEGDTIHRAAGRLQVLVGERVEVETPNPRAQAAIDAGQLDGRLLESVQALGKNLVFRFEGGIVLRSHLRMTGSWSVRPRREPSSSGGSPWLVLRGSEVEGVLWNGPVLELHARALARLGPDILASPPDIDAMLGRMAQADGSRWLGEALLDQSIVAGIGNMWLAEALWAAELSPWRRLGDVPEPERRLALETAARLMRAAVDGARPPGHRVYRRSGRPCSRCRTLIRSRGQGDSNRIAYWCPSCQVGDDPPAAY
jgi:endonuclease-8